MNDPSILKYLEKFQKSPKKRPTILQQTLLPWLKQQGTSEAQHRSKTSNRMSWLHSLRDKKSSSKRKSLPADTGICQSILLPWWRVLIECVPYVHLAEQGFYFDCIVAIMSRYEFIAYDLRSRTIPAEDTQYTGLLRATLEYAIDITSISNPPPGAVIFCAHILALCFFKVPGLASSLLANLPVKPSAIKRLQREMMDNAASHAKRSSSSSDMYASLPTHLHPLMKAPTTPTTKRTGDTFHFTPQWLARWQTSDRAFFILFYQYYHTCLMSYIAEAIPEPQLLSLHERNAILAISPGYMHLSAYMAARVITLLQTQYTASPPTASKEAVSTILALSAQQRKTSLSNKPRALEAATRRYAYCLTWCSTSASLFNDMLNVWLRTIVTSIRWTDSESVFCLLDLIDNVIADLQRKSGNLPPVDLPFLIHALQLILERADSAIIHLRTFALIYTHFDFLTQRVDLLDVLCNRVLLQPYIFESFITHWHSSVRAYYLQCLFWRVSPLWSSEFVCWDPSLPNSCDGKRCFRDSWLQGSTASTFDGITDRAKYRQCTLEIHRTLEVLLKLFRQHHAYLNQQLESRKLDSSKERQKFLAQLQSSSCSTTAQQQQQQQTHFRSQLLTVTSTTSTSNKKYQREIYVFPSPYRLSFIGDDTSDDADSGYISSGNTTPRPSLLPDNNWQYRATAHVYATKAIEEIQSLTQFARVTPSIPSSLSVDWPSAWTNPLL
ncbi:hypothetical protein VTP01DRAFT_6807 [Rhizomucor pusillus]|uniref:uncharacterized protein n=1 Tax=Rhizomucor pusillus TaxID=4840 RepID=UPI0037431BDA